MTMRASVYAVIGTFPSGKRARLADFETRAEAEEYSTWQQEEQMVEGATFEVCLLDRPRPYHPDFAEFEAAMAEKRQEEVRDMLRAAMRREPLPSEMRRALAVAP